MNDVIRDCLKKATKTYEREKYCQFSLESLAFFIVEVFKEIEKQKIELTDENVEKINEEINKVIKKDGNAINNLMDLELLKLEDPKFLIWKYEPLAHYKMAVEKSKHNKEIELTFGDLLEPLRNKIAIARKTFRGQNENGKPCTFRTYYNTILFTIIYDICKKRGYYDNENRRVPLNDDYQITKSIEDSEVLDKCLERFNNLILDLDFIDYKNSDNTVAYRNLFRLLIFIYFYVPFEETAITAVFDKEVLAKIIKERPAFRKIKKEKNKLEELFKYYGWLNSGAWTFTSFERFFKRNRKGLTEKFFKKTNEKFQTKEENELLEIIFNKWFDHYHQ